MATLTIRDALPKQFEKDIDEMFMDGIAEYPDEYQKVFLVKDFPKGRYYTAAELSGLGEVAEIGEGGRITYDTAEEGHEKSYELVKYGLGFVITEEAVDDDYHGKLMQLPKTLARSMKDKVNYEAMKVFNVGDTAESSGGVESWDDEPVFDTAHDVLKSTSTISNKGTADLSETSMQAAFEYFMDLIDEAGHKIRVVPNHLMVPPKLMWTAGQLAKQFGGVTPYPAASPDLSGNLMTVNPTHGIVPSWDYGVYRWLTDDENWFFISTNPGVDYMRPQLLWRKKINLQEHDDPETGSMHFGSKMRFVVAVLSYKALYGSFPT